MKVVVPAYILFFVLIVLLVAFYIHTSTAIIITIVSGIVIAVAYVAIKYFIKRKKK